MNKKPEIACFITARTDSSRLSNKMLLDIRGKSIIEHDIFRAKLAKKIGRVILCTSERPQDDILEEIANRNHILCFRGSLSDKLERWHGACETFGIDYFITFDGDDMFCEPELIDSAAEQIRLGGADFIFVPEGLICGAFTYAISVAALRRVCEIKNTEETEMQWVYFTATGLFKAEELRIEDKIFFNSKIRMTLDYKEDFDFFTRIMNEFNTDLNNIPLRRIVELIQEKPEIAGINYFRQEEFLRNQKNKTKLILKSKYTYEKNK